jgi:hypothetical protein
MFERHSKDMVASFDRLLRYILKYVFEV